VPGRKVKEGGKEHSDQTSIPSRTEEDVSGKESALPSSIRSGGRNPLSKRVRGPGVWKFHAFGGGNVSGKGRSKAITISAYGNIWVKRKQVSRNLTRYPFFENRGRLPGGGILLIGRRRRSILPKKKKRLRAQFSWEMTMTRWG